MIRCNNMLFLCLLIPAIIGGCTRFGFQGSDSILAKELSTRQKSHAESMVLCRKGIHAYEASNLTEAHRHLNKAVNIDASNTYAWIALGVVQFEQGNLYDAANAFHKASRLEPGRYEPHYNLGKVYEFSGHYAKAVKEYEAALELSPDALEVMENLARCYLRTDVSRKKALELIGRASRLETREDWKAWLQEQLRRLSDNSKVKS